MQDNISKLKNYQNNKGILLFFIFLVGAERGEVEVWPTSGTMRWRGGIPWPLGGGCGASPRRPRFSCRCGGRRSRGNRTCRGRVRRATLWLLAHLPPCYVANPAEAPSWLRWGLRCGPCSRQAPRRWRTARTLGGLARFGVRRGELLFVFGPLPFGKARR